MYDVFATWDPAIIEFFMARGGDVSRGNPFAHALIAGIHRVLSTCRRHIATNEHLQRQADIALRHYCFKGDARWANQLMRAGANPFCVGPFEPDQDVDEGGGWTAAECAAWGGHVGILKSRHVKLDPTMPRAKELLQAACHAGSAEVIELLLNAGFDPNDRDGPASSYYRSLLGGATFPENIYEWGRRSGIDSTRSREAMKAIHLLARHGARWAPKDRSEMNECRKSLLKLTPPYSFEFAWILAGYRVASQEDLTNLFRTPAIQEHTARFSRKLRDMVASAGTEVRKESG